MDVLQLLKIDPLVDYKNVNMLSHFVTELGHIKHRNETGLSAENQLKVTKAIKRAQMENSDLIDDFRTTFSL